MRYIKVLYKNLFIYLFIIVIAACCLPSAEAALISTKEEISIGQSVARDLEKKIGLVDDPNLQNRVAAIGKRLLEGSDRKELPYTFKVLNHKEINALALPGGPIYIFKGLVDYMPADEELAGVIAHEISHIVKRHSVKQIEKSLGVSIIFGIVFGTRGAFLQNLAQQVIMAGYSRSDEREADKLGFNYLLKAGYNPYSILMTMQKLAELHNAPNYGLFSSHPEPEARLKLLNNYLTESKIQPKVIQDGQHIKVTEATWTFPEILAQASGYKPLYRSYFLAGKLYLIGQQKNINPNKFILFEEDNKTTIFYDDIAVFTVYSEDAAVKGEEIAGIAAACRDSLRQWAQLKIAPANKQINTAN